MSAGDSPSSPASPTFEDAKEDFQAFLSQSKTYQVEMTDSMVIEDESRKRPLPSSTEEEEAVEPTVNIKSSKKRQVNSSTATSTSKKPGKQPQTSTGKTNPKGEVVPPIKNQGSKPGLNEPTTLYGAYTKAPFIVIFRIPSAKDQSRKRFSMITVAKKLMSANVKYDSIASSSFNTWRVTFPSKASANLAMRNKFIKDEGFITYIPKYKLTRQFVIRDIPLDLPLTELKTVIEEENQDILISDLFRLKRRDRITGIWSDSEAVCVQKLGEDLPDNVKIYRTIAHTSPFQRSVRLCFNCGLFGHLSKFCERNPRCLQCGNEDHISSKETPCIKPK